MNAMFNKNKPASVKPPVGKDCPKCEEYLAGWKRAQADYQNLVKETDARMQLFRQFAAADTLAQIFPLVDYFKQAFKQIPEAEQKAPWLQGVKHIQTYLQKILQDNQVEEIKTVGEVFNPEFHEAVKQEPGEKDQIILAEVSTGFISQGKVLQPAKVVISVCSSKISSRDKNPEFIPGKNNKINN